MQIGRLPYYYFLLLERTVEWLNVDWKTAVLLLPSTEAVISMASSRLEDCRIITSFYYARTGEDSSRIGRLPYYYFLLLRKEKRLKLVDWKTAVLLLPFTSSFTRTAKPKIGRLPYYYFLLLGAEERATVTGLEDCRIITSFYFGEASSGRVRIGRLPYYYFLLLGVTLRLTNARLEDCRIITSFY